MGIHTHSHTHTNHNTHLSRGATVKLNPPALAHKGSRINLAPIKKYNVSTTTKWVFDIYIKRQIGQGD